jgi:hypothetical protein
LLSPELEGFGRIEGIKAVRREEEREEGILGTGATVNEDRATVVNLSDRARSALTDDADQEQWVLDQNPDEPGIQLEEPDPFKEAEKETADAKDVAEPEFQGLTDMEREIVRELRAKDRNVRFDAAEQKALAGAFAGTEGFEVQIGPDGEPYYVQSRVPVTIAATGNGFDTTVRARGPGSDAGLPPEVTDSFSDAADPIGETLTPEANDHVGDYAGAIFRPSSLEGLLRPNGTLAPLSGYDEAKQYANPFTELADPLAETVASFLAEYDGTSRWQHDVPRPGSYFRRASNAYTSAGTFG